MCCFYGGVCLVWGSGERSPQQVPAVLQEVSEHREMNSSPANLHGSVLPCLGLGVWWDHAEGCHRSSSLPVCLPAVGQQSRVPLAGTEFRRAKGARISC